MVSHIKLCQPVPLRTKIVKTKLARIRTHNRHDVQIPKLTLANPTTRSKIHNF